MNKSKPQREFFFIIYISINGLAVRLHGEHCNDSPFHLGIFVEISVRILCTNPKANLTVKFVGTKVVKIKILD